MHSLPLTLKQIKHGPDWSFPYPLADGDKEPPTTAAEPVSVSPNPTGEHTLHFLLAETPLAQQWVNGHEPGNI